MKTGILALLGALLSICVLAGCSEDDDAVTDAGPTSPDDTTIRVVPARITAIQGAIDLTKADAGRIAGLDASAGIFNRFSAGHRFLRSADWPLAPAGRLALFVCKRDRYRAHRCSAGGLRLTDVKGGDVHRGGQLISCECRLYAEPVGSAGNLPAIRLICCC